MSSAPLIQKLWGYCNVLGDDGMSYGDYVEQLTYLQLYSIPSLVAVLQISARHSQWRRA